MAKHDQILRFKITLNGIKPPIWRRIEIPSNATFWALHVAIQDAMGWTDTHLHEFHTTDRFGPGLRIGIPDEDGWDNGIVAGWTRKISPVFKYPGTKAEYLYDFGDGWEHTVLLEAIEPARPGVEYPVCVGGRRRCPPEDCGGPWGYESLLEILADPTHEEHAEMLEWAGGPIDPEAFDPTAVRFEDPAERLSFVRD